MGPVDIPTTSSTEQNSRLAGTGLPERGEHREPLNTQLLPETCQGPAVAPSARRWFPRGRAADGRQRLLMTGRRGGRGQSWVRNGRASAAAGDGVMGPEPPDERGCGGQGKDKLPPAQNHQRGRGEPVQGGTRSEQAAHPKQPRTPARHPQTRGRGQRRAR